MTSRPEPARADAEELAQARAWLAQAQSVVALTGAGMSAESGIATFRDAMTGLWARFGPVVLSPRSGIVIPHPGRRSPGLRRGRSRFPCDCSHRSPA